MLPKKDGTRGLRIECCSCYAHKNIPFSVGVEADVKTFDNTNAFDESKAIGFLLGHITLELAPLPPPSPPPQSEKEEALEHSTSEATPVSDLVADQSETDVDIL